MMTESSMGMRTEKKSPIKKFLHEVETNVSEVRMVMDYTDGEKQLTGVCW